MTTDSPNLTDIRAQLGEIRRTLLRTARYLVERQNPGDADEGLVEVEDDRVTILRVVVILDAAMDALDESTR